MHVDGHLMERFVAMASEELSGDWVVMGGSVLSLVGAGSRVTLDIDVAGPPESRQEQALLLMQIAERLGLSVEAINQAGAYFLHRIAGWQDRLVVVKEGRGARILRPDVTLFLQLKVRRMSESDLSDCTSFVRWCSRRGERPDMDAALGAIDESHDSCESAGQRQRLEELRTFLLAL
jgi:hypothetical protein